MKTKVLLLVVVVLIIAVFVGNRIYGNKIAREIDADLRAKMAKNELPVNFEYSGIKVNPLFSELTIADLSVSGFDSTVLFTSHTVDIDIPYKEALRLAESTDFEEINSLKVTFVKPLLKVGKNNMLLGFNDLTVDFDGHLTKADLEQIQDQFPATKQELKCSFSSMELQLPEQFLKMSPFSDLQKQFTQFDKGSYTVAYLPGTNALNVTEVELKSSVVSYSGNTTIHYKGDGLKNFVPQSTDTESDLLFQPKDISWENEAGGKGEFELKRLKMTVNSTANMNSKTFPEGELKLELEKLKVKIDNPNKSNRNPMKFSLNDFDVEKLNVNYRLNKEKMTISDTGIESSMLNATIFADVDMDTINVANSTINAAKVEIADLAPKLEEMLTGFEQQMGKELPREDGKIVLELSGRLMRPTIKGFEF